MTKVFTAVCQFAAVLLFTLSAHAEDVVLIVGNLDVNASVNPRHDSRGNTSLINDFRLRLPQINPNLEVQSIMVTDDDALVESVAAETTTLRGIIFLGHGNEKNYALNRNVMFDGRSMAELLAEALEGESLGADFTIYFAGCLMARAAQGGNFQETFFSWLDAIAALSAKVLLPLAFLSPYVLSQSSPLYAVAGVATGLSGYAFLRFFKMHANAWEVRAFRNGQIENGRSDRILSRAFQRSSSCYDLFSAEQPWSLQI